MTLVIIQLLKVPVAYYLNENDKM